MNIYFYAYGLDRNIPSEETHDASPILEASSVFKSTFSGFLSGLNKFDTKRFHRRVETSFNNTLLHEIISIPLRIFNVSKHPRAYENYLTQDSIVNYTRIHSPFFFLSNKFRFQTVSIDILFHTQDVVLQFDRMKFEIIFQYYQQKQ